MRLEHIALFAADTLALADWYCRHFGMRVVFRNEAEPPTFFVADPRGICLELIGRKGPPAVEDTGRVFHFAFVLDDDAAFDEAVSRLGAGGVPLEKEGGGDGLRVRFFYDPAGNRGQIIKRPKPLA
jgi:catechol 2,3-dioxygenase-like lactoylglutathione lyase family enzyme